MIKTDQLLTELIALSSVNPAFLPPGHPRAGEQSVAEYLLSIAARAGLDVELQTVLPGRPNVLARLTPNGPTRRRVVLAPHMDTVNAADAGFAPRRSGGRLFGRGSCDTKGSVAAMLAALCEVANSKGRPRETEILFAGLIDEEYAQAGSRFFARHVRADLAIVGEPTRGEIVTAHKGNLWLRLETRGRAAHGSRPELGVNAIRAMAGIVDALETDYSMLLQGRRHSLLGAGTVNVGVIHGGTQPNIVPDRCSIAIDRRTLPGETEASVRRELKRFLQERKLKATLDTEKPVSCLPMETDPRQPLVRLFLKVARQRKPAGVHFFCDAAVLAEGGIPSVVFGPGDVAQAHTVDEWISLASLERARALLVHYLQSLP
jgi:acetylornithine deacetylase